MNFTTVLRSICSTTAACLIFWGAISGEKSYPYCLASATFLTYIALQATAGAFMTGIKIVLPGQAYIDIMAIVVAIAFQISTCLFLFHFFQIFYVSEVLQFLISHLYKLMLRKIWKMLLLIYTIIISCKCSVFIWPWNDRIWNRTGHSYSHGGHIWKRISLTF